jgi:hypothetical protein
VEQTFVNKDGVGTLKLGQARGIALLVTAQAGLTIGEYAPNAVKKAVVGVGHADKVQIAHMVKLQLPGVKLAGPDAADALARAEADFQPEVAGAEQRLQIKGDAIRVFLPSHRAGREFVEVLIQQIKLAVAQGLALETAIEIAPRRAGRVMGGVFPVGHGAAP